MGLDCFSHGLRLKRWVALPLGMMVGQTPPKSDLIRSILILLISRISRCMPFPPPNSRAVNDDWIADIGRVNQSLKGQLNDKAHDPWQ